DEAVELSLALVEPLAEVGVLAAHRAEDGADRAAADLEGLVITHLGAQGRGDANGHRLSHRQTSCFLRRCLSGFSPRKPDLKRSRQPGRSRAGSRSTRRTGPGARGWSAALQRGPA